MDDRPTLRHPCTMFVWITNAWAFQLEGHRVLTERAIALERSACPALAEWSSVLIGANLAEDLNLAVKWGRHSHYYRPVGAVDTGWRSTSEVRVEGLAAELDAALEAGNIGAAWGELGRILHHVQDMASPSHVVPVKHGLDDPFESRELTGLTGQRALPEATDPLGAHHALALETWERVTSEVELAAYWVVEGEGFGAYGESGVQGGGAPFEALHAVQAEAALAYTRAVLRAEGGPMCGP